ncbi:type II secretion system protein GspM [Marimonas arenosa]|uniref:Type II secretion system protein GspM n=1 Tax=Marimonas arenosa TaxID=1795305 RepID=A0AAE3WGG1_9RHOB|nr:type II secretion system protein GspM [Marimonas arenosa]MDQ2092214.1 type II secretion system protein GspM [Marimonas arenosa]
MNLVDWLAERSGRERVLLALLTGLLLPLAVVLGLLVPLAEKRAAAEQALEEAQLLNAWVAARAAEAAKLAPVREEPDQTFDPIGVSALEQGLKQARLWPYVARLEARSQGGIALDFEVVEFTDLMRWLEAAHPRWGYAFDTFRIEPRLESAMVKATIVLRAAGDS